MSVNVTLNGIYGDLVIQSDGNYVYTPNTTARNLLTTETKQDIFRYTIEDPGRTGIGTSDTATLKFYITGTVEAESSAADDNYTIGSQGGSHNNGLIVADVLANDQGASYITHIQPYPSGTTQSITAGGSVNIQTDYGSLYLESDGSMQYTPNRAVYIGAIVHDRFKYTTNYGSYANINIEIYGEHHTSNLTSLGGVAGFLGNWGIDDSLTELSDYQLGKYSLPNVSTNIANLGNLGITSGPYNLEPLVNTGNLLTSLTCTTLWAGLNDNGSAAPLIFSTTRGTTTPVYFQHGWNHIPDYPGSGVMPQIELTLTEGPLATRSNVQGANNVDAYSVKLDLDNSSHRSQIIFNSNASPWPITQSYVTFHPLWDSWRKDGISRVGHQDQHYWSLRANQFLSATGQTESDAGNYDFLVTYYACRYTYRINYSTYEWNSVQNIYNGSKYQMKNQARWFFNNKQTHAKCGLTNNGPDFKYDTATPFAIDGPLAGRYTSNYRRCWTTELGFDWCTNKNWPNPMQPTGYVRRTNDGNMYTGCEYLNAPTYCEGPLENFGEAEHFCSRGGTVNENNLFVAGPQDGLRDNNCGTFASNVNCTLPGYMFYTGAEPMGFTMQTWCDIISGPQYPSLINCTPCATTSTGWRCYSCSVGCPATEGHQQWACVKGIDKHYYDNGGHTFGTYSCSTCSCRDRSFGINTSEKMDADMGNIPVGYGYLMSYADIVTAGGPTNCHLFKDTGNNYITFDAFADHTYFNNNLLASWTAGWQNKVNTYYNTMSHNIFTEQLYAHSSCANDVYSSTQHGENFSSACVQWDAPTAGQSGGFNNNINYAGMSTRGFWNTNFSAFNYYWPNEISLLFNNLHIYSPGDNSLLCSETITETGWTFSPTTENSFWLGEPAGRDAIIALKNIPANVTRWASFGPFQPDNNGISYNLKDMALDLFDYNDYGLGYWKNGVNVDPYDPQYTGQINSYMEPTGHLTFSGSDVQISLFEAFVKNSQLNTISYPNLGYKFIADVEILRCVSNNYNNSGCPAGNQSGC
jgi:VCBS repeat-containing protein